ncbi:hypothetical protein JR316_0000806 [Psilocybe cubensis]|uniref:AB hydrolase-1 domain-containing protein n=2 Tax=Psilocybe cubensis TaxID=181762 RepID=A0A8H7YA73_PSICU|nr:hypothetical protein JR316_0000806 [Psilocybe cubensis]KAH9486741.1 hypothetical protein JR316_0000806 [Psilocybe cubensis]
MLARSPFVNDLVPLILDANNDWWPRDFVALSLVSSAWLYHARKRLYPCPTVHTFRAAILLADTLSETPYLASLVEGISLQPLVTDSQRRPLPAELKSLRHLLGLEGLRRVRLGGELAVKAERFLRLISNAEEIKELHIDGSAIRDRLSMHASLEWDESLAFGFPSLDKLRLTDTELDIIPPSLQYTTPITQLILENTYIVDGYLTNLLAGATTLKRLHVSTGDPDVFEEQVRLVLASCAVECLHYEAQKDNKTVVQIMPSNGGALRCLHLRGLCVDLGVLASVNEECVNLVELGVWGRGVGISAQEWTEFLKSGGFGGLERLGLPWGSNVPPFATWGPTEIERIRRDQVDLNYIHPMQSILSRHNTNSSQHIPRKSSSFLSLRREKDKSSPADPSFDVAGPSNSSPSSYFDAYPRPKPSTIPRLVKSRTSRPSPTRDSPTSDPSTPGPTYAFPSFDPADDFSTPRPPLGTNQYSRTRSRTGPSGKSNWDSSSAVPQLRFSNSSSTQHTETPPRTPDDYTPSIDSFDVFPSVVAAPIAGVETMDALVDGMNGGDALSSSRRTMISRPRFGIPGHHPLYQPPLPTPPPGIVLGGGKARPKLTRKSSSSADSSDDEAFSSMPTPASRTRRRRVRPSSSRASVNQIATPAALSRTPDDQRTFQASPNPTRSPRPKTTESADARKTVVPSISEIIRNHAPPEAQVRSRPAIVRSSSLYSPSSQGHATVHEEVETELGNATRGEAEEEEEFLSRSSIDSVADEVQRTIRHQGLPKPPPVPPPSSASAYLKRQSTISDNASVLSPRSDPGVASIYSVSAPSSYYPTSPLEQGTFISMAKNSPSQAVAQYLRSARLTTLLKLTRSPHASQDNPLTVSLSDLGSPTGFPVVVFLGLGCVRHIMGLYDEMASCMGLRLITIDRWGLGRTEPRSKSTKGIMQWASVVEEVLDLLRIDQCSIMAHSAGAPYALSFANKLPSRIVGDICLLAPWVGGTESSGYKWLKYVPNSILKTAQAAEWKIQAWMIGKPPTIAYEGIGYTAPSTSKPSTKSSTSTAVNLNNSVSSEARPRPSMGSNFSEYDDLRDFDGRFESRSTLGLKQRPVSQYGRRASEEGSVPVTKRKTSRGILDRFKGTSSPPQPMEKAPTSAGKKLKALRSMGSLKSKSQNQTPRSSEPSSPHLPPSLLIDVGLGLEDLSWAANIENDIDNVNLHTARPPVYGNGSMGSLPRSTGSRSISFTSSSNAPTSMPGSPAPSSLNISFGQTQSNLGNHHVAIGNALIAASHAESAKGTHNDLLQILNHENHSWGFSYSSYPHRVRIWYGDRDEKIAENAVRWMERTMGTDQCSVKVVKGADHGLMYRSSAVVDVLEWILSAWRPDDRIAQPFSDLR